MNRARRFALLGPYNGFTGLERARGAELTWWAVSAGLIARPSSCSICGTDRRKLQLHSENYYQPLSPFPICVSCHMRLHMRFREPAPWQRLVRAYAWCDAWFASLELRPVDLAKMLRDRHGDEIADVRATVLRQLPPHITPPLGRFVVQSDFP